MIIFSFYLEQHMNNDAFLLRKINFFFFFYFAFKVIIFSSLDLFKCLIISIFLSIQSLFGSWLAEKEKALSEIQTCDFRDPSEINGSVRRLAVSRQTCITLYL